MKERIAEELNRITASIREAHTDAEKAQACQIARGRMLSLAGSAPAGSARRTYATKMLRKLEEKSNELRFLDPVPVPPGPLPDPEPAGRGKNRRKEQSEEEDIENLVDVYQPEDVPDDRTLEDLQMHEKDRAKLTRRVILPLKYPHEMNAAGVYPASYILYGPPGTGKTTIAQAIAKEADATLVVVNGASIKGKYYGQSQSRLTQIIRYVEELVRTGKHPVVLLFDDCDALLGKTWHGAGKDIIAAFLTGFDGVGHKAAKRPFPVIFTTNKPDAFEENVVRRIGNLMYIGPPNASQRLQFLENQIGKLPNISLDIDLREIAEKTRGYSCADLEHLLEEANDEREDDSVIPPRFLPLSGEHLKNAIEKTTPTLRESVVEPYVRFARERGLFVPEYD